MARIEHHYIGGKSASEEGLVRINWNGALPLPPDTASPRQILDFATIVALSESRNSVELPRILGLAVRAYEQEYNVQRVPIND
ncbi:MAG TPA: hypothetical protein VFQ45_17630 [Longimicrobium sp.]|nr:hypothetical protein [Longimicrobium sp.]